MGADAISADEIIAIEFQNAADELFEFYSGAAPLRTEMTSLELTHLGTANDEVFGESTRMIYATVSLIGEGFRCSLGLLSSVDTACTLFGDEPNCPVDWLGELANQLVGRLKNNLSPYNVEPKLGIPTSTRGTQLQMSQTGLPGRIDRCETSAGTLISLLEIQSAPGLFWQRDEQVEVADEGSSWFFV